MGRIHSFMTMGTVDGPGVRFVVFMQGCPLRCRYCHNPDTWDITLGEEFSAEAIVEKLSRYKSYFGEDGGITVSGGEPLMQAKFVAEIFDLCKQSGIHTCLDTSGCILNDDVRALLEVTDLVLLDVKMTTEEAYEQYTGGSLSRTIEFLAELQSIGIATWIRQVIVEGINDTSENIDRLNQLISQYNCIKKVELLPFKKLCLEKYYEMGIPFPLENTNETTIHTIEQLTSLIAFRE